MDAAGTVSNPGELREHPAIETGRCLIRPFLVDDVEAALAYLSDPVVMEHVEPPFDRDRTEQFVTSAGVEEGLVHVVVEKESGRVIGHVIWHPWAGRPDVWELGWILRRDRWGQGLATELGLALLDQERRMRHVDMVIAEAHPANAASVRTIEAIGLVRAPELDPDLPVWKRAVQHRATGSPSRAGQSSRPRSLGLNPQTS